MKTNAIIRIICYSLLVIILLGLLLAGIGGNSFHFPADSDQISTSSGSVEAAAVSSLSIDWAAGSITIRTADTDRITFEESGDISRRYTMTYNHNNSKLEIQFCKSATVSIGNLPSKNLVITVPNDWVCKELELDAAAVEVSIQGLTVHTLELDGAAGEIDFLGSVDRVECDGASVKMHLHCYNRPSSINMDGASCELKLTLPSDYGYVVQMDGLGCDFHSNDSFACSGNVYTYGDQQTKIDVDGLSCDIEIEHSQSDPLPTSPAK